MDQRLSAAIIRNARAFHAMAWTDDDRVAAHSAYHSVITIELGLKAMTLRTGKGSAGGQYRDYACSTKARMGEADCAGLAVPMHKSDDASSKDRVAEFSGIRDQARADAERISASVDRLAPMITPDALARFATAARRKLRDRTSGYRRDHLRALTQRVEVISKTEARIIGSRTELLRALGV